MIQTNRIEALDVLRGFTVALMIMVNNAGESWSFMHHAEWNGLSLSDVVFPFFLFIMGVSTYLSLSKSEFRADKETTVRIVRRVCIIILVCWGIFWFGRVLWGDYLPFDHFRLTGVLVRIALVYGLLSILALAVKHKWLPYIAAALLVLYSVVLMLGNGYSNDASNILSRADVFLLGSNHLYTWTPIDPEGVLGLIPSLAHGIIGFMCGKLLRSDIEIKVKIRKMCIVGAALVATGLVLGIWMPLNKRIWSPSFVLVTTGLAEILLGALTYLIDVRGNAGNHVCNFFRVFGTNSLSIYALSELLSVTFAATGVSGFCIGFLRNAIPSVEFADFTYCFLFMLLNFLFGLILYKKHIIIKA